MWLFYLLVALIFIFLSLRQYIYGNDHYWPERNVPCVFGHQIGSFWDRALFRIPIHELDHRVYKLFRAAGLGGVTSDDCARCASRKAKFGGVWELRSPVTYVMDLDLVKHILIKDFDHFSNRRRFGRQDDPSLFGKMLLSKEDQDWKDMRVALSPTFATGKVKRMHSIFTESSRRLTAFLRKEIGSGADLDLKDACTRVTMDVVASSAFGIDSQIFQDKNSIFSQMGKRFQNQLKGWGVLKLLMALMLPSLFNLLGLSVMDDQASKFFSEVTKKTIEHRRRTGERREDFLQLLLDARDGQLTADNEDEEVAQKGKTSAVKWTDDEVLAQCLMFFLGGFDTIETTLTYALYALAVNPDIQDRLATKIDEASAAAGDGHLSYDALNELEYLDMVISETLRQYPPGARAERKCTNEYLVPGTQHRIPVDQVCIIPIYGIHHDPEYYPEPEKFIPERFSAENKRNRNPSTYLPFGAGPRMCIAPRFATMEAKTVIAHLVHNFRIEPCSKTLIPLEYEASVHMIPKGGMWLKMTPRNK